MTRFTLRSALVLAVVLLLAGATTSFGAAVLTVSSSGNPPVRIAGQTEGTGDINLSTTATGADTFPANNGNMVISLIYNAPITNRTLTSTLSTCTANIGTVTCAPGDIVGASSVGIKVTVNTITVTGTAKGDAVAVSWSVSGNILTITFAPNTTTASIAFNNGAIGCPGVGCVATTIGIHGVRVNTASLGVPPTSPIITAFINANPVSQVSFAGTAPTLTVGTLAAALSSVTRISGSTNSNDAFYQVPGGIVSSTLGTCTATDCNNALKLRPKSSYTVCAIRGIPEGASPGGSVVVTDDQAVIDRNGSRDFGGNGGSNAIGIRIVEGFPGALTSSGDEAKKSNAGEVNNGTRIRITFSGLPSQVVIAGLEEVTSAATSAVTAYAGSTGLTLDLVNNNVGCTVGACGAGTPAIADVRANSGGTIIFDYEVASNTGASTGILSAINLPFFVYQTSSPVDQGTINISVQLAPILGSAIVRFSDTQTANTSTVAINACTTDLFYPFITNVAGFDTGIFIMNGGQQRDDNSGQSGTCTMRFFDGSTSGTTAVKSTTTPALGPGQSFSFTVSDPTNGKPGFGNGYINARCNFQNAHGAAYVTFAFGTAPIGSAPPGTIYLAMQCNPEDNCNNR